MLLGPQRLPGHIRLGHTLLFACREWHEDKALRMAAAIAFYTVFSITPIVVMAYQAASATFGAEAALREILGQAASLIGKGSCLPSGGSRPRSKRRADCPLDARPSHSRPEPADH